MTARQRVPLCLPGTLRNVRQNPLPPAARAALAPCRTLMAKATGATPELLGERELAALIRLDFDINTLLRFGGLVA